MRSAFLSVVLGILLNSMALADQLVLKNGDRLSGVIVRSDGKKLVIKSDYAGDVTVDWTAIQQITSDHSLHVGLSNGKTAVGTIATADGNVQVVNKNGDTVETPKSDIVLMRNDAEQGAYEQSLNPRLSENWAAGANFGFALTRGNSQSKNLALAFNADRKTLHDKLALYSTAVYSTNDAPGAIPSTTANAEQGGIRYDHDITPRLFDFIGADFQADSLQLLNLRSVLGAGLGFHVIKREATTLDVLAGANYTHESYLPFSRNFPSATFGDEFMHKLHGSTVVTQSLYFYPNLSDTGEYRTTFTFGTITKMSKWLGWQNSFGDIYVSNPPAGRKKNDIIFTTGLSVTFIHSDATK